MKRKIISSLIIGIAIVGLLAKGWNNEEIEETETEEFESEKIRTEETSYAGEQDNGVLCEAIKNLDFSSKEYPVNREIYTPEVEQEYKEAFYMTITNQVPLEYGEE